MNKYGRDFKDVQRGKTSRVKRLLLFIDFHFLDKRTLNVCFNNIGTEQSKNPFTEIYRDNSDDEICVNYSGYTNCVQIIGLDEIEEEFVRLYGYWDGWVFQ